MSARRMAYIASPSRLTFTSTVSSSQSTRSSTTSRRLPERLALLTHSVLRVRLKKVAKPVRLVRPQRLLVHEADHQDLRALGVLDDALESARRGFENPSFTSPGATRPAKKTPRRCWERAGCLSV